jgi:hypothetical protein
MKTVRWDNVGYTALTVLLMILALMQANWFAFCAVLLSAYFMVRSEWYRYNLMRARHMLVMAKTFMDMVIEEHEDDDTQA